MKAVIEYILRTPLPPRVVATILGIPEDEVRLIRRESGARRG